MNDLDTNTLRAALAPWRPAPTQFEAGVLARLSNPSPFAEPNASEDSDELLRVAASVMPFALQNNLPTTAGIGSWGKLPLTSKLIGWAALPAIGIFFAIGGSLFAAATMRRFVASAGPPNDDPAEQAAATHRWWQSYRVPLMVLWGCILIGPFFGMPVSFLFLCVVSSVAMMSLIRILANYGFANRDEVGGSCVAGLCLLAQAIDGTRSLGSKPHLLDTALLPAILWTGALCLILFIRPIARVGTPKILSLLPVRLLFLVLLGGLIAFSSQTLWWPVNSKTVQHVVETFDAGRRQRMTWQHWAICVSALKDAGIEPNLAVARRSLDKILDQQEIRSVMSPAAQVGLLRPAEVSQLQDFQSDRETLLKPWTPGRAPALIPSLDLKRGTIELLAASGRLTVAERDTLEHKLLKSLDSLKPTFDLLGDLLTIDQLLERIDRPLDREKYRDQVHTWLVKLQCKTGRFGIQAGGFSLGEQLEFSDLSATADAIELMKSFGVPEQVDLIALRSYLRPQRSDRFVLEQAALRAATRMQLATLPTGSRIPPWWKVVLMERDLIFATLLVLVCIYGTWICPSHQRVPPT